MERFDKFTEEARQALTRAVAAAKQFRHSYVGTEHLLLGLLYDEDSAAAKVLLSLGVTTDKVGSAIRFIIGEGERSAPPGEPGLTPRAKKVVELALDEVRRTNQKYIGSEHLLIGLVREGEGIAFGVLQSLGVTYESVRDAVAADHGDHLRLAGRGSSRTVQLRRWGKRRSPDQEPDADAVIHGMPVLEYATDSRWVGWWGGYGSQEELTEAMNERARDGWRLVRIETGIFLWAGFLPRRRMLLVWER